MDTLDADYLDEAFSGPPPRFLRDRVPVDQDKLANTEPEECSLLSRTFRKFSAFFAGDWLRQD
jgi:hypothetical protein